MPHKRTIILELIFHMKDTIIKAGSRRLLMLSAAWHLTKEGGNGTDRYCISEQGHHE